VRCCVLDRLVESALRAVRYSRLDRTERGKIDVVEAQGVDRYSSSVDEHSRDSGRAVCEKGARVYWRTQMAGRREKRRCEPPQKRIRRRRERQPSWNRHRWRPLSLICSSSKRNHQAKALGGRGSEGETTNVDAVPGGV
jgi:hypothetical protein